MKSSSSKMIITLESVGKSFSINIQVDDLSVSFGLRDDPESYKDMLDSIRNNTLCYVTILGGTIKVQNEKIIFKRHNLRTGRKLRLSFNASEFENVFKVLADAASSAKVSDIAQIRYVLDV